MLLRKLPKSKSPNQCLLYKMVKKYLYLNIWRVFNNSLWIIVFMKHRVTATVNIDRISTMNRWLIEGCWGTFFLGFIINYVSEIYLWTKDFWEIFFGVLKKKTFIFSSHTCLMKILHWLLVDFFSDQLSKILIKKVCLSIATIKEKC